MTAMDIYFDISKLVDSLVEYGCVPMNYDNFDRWNELAHRLRYGSYPTADITAAMKYVAFIKYGLLIQPDI